MTSIMGPESIVRSLPIDLESWENTSELTEAQAPCQLYCKKSSNNIHNLIAHYNKDFN